MILNGMTRNNISKGAPPPCSSRITSASDKRPGSPSSKKKYANRESTVPGDVPNKLIPASTGTRPKLPPIQRDNFHLLFPILLVGVVITESSRIYLGLLEAAGITEGLPQGLLAAEDSCSANTASHAVSCAFDHRVLAASLFYGQNDFYHGRFNRGSPRGGPLGALFQDAPYISFPVQNGDNLKGVRV
jgi:hypothetical protein